MLLRIALSLIAGTATSTIGSPIKEGSKRYAIIVGVNKPAKADQRPLRYADDDAVRFYEVFRALSGEAALFALLDEETQRSYPEVVPEAELPEKRLIFSRAERMFERIQSDRAAGFSTELYLIYSGHGYADEGGEGKLGLEDGTFSRTELYEQFLAKSPAHVNHVIVDACDAYFFVQARGTDPEVEKILNARAREFLDRQTLSRFPNTGAILSTASAAESHEWSEIRGGVFSHEVRSALLGAADADQDGSISYDELEAFVLAANLGVRHAGASRAVFVRAPDRDRLHPVIDLGAMRRAHRLTIGSTVTGRIAIADELGRRYLDLHKAGGFALALRLLPGLRYFVRVGEVDYPVPSGEPEIDLSTLPATEPTTAARGAGIADAYAKGLFAVPFGPQLVDGFRIGIGAQDLTVAIAPESHPLRTAGWVAGGASVLAAGVAAAFWFGGGESAHDEYDAVKSDPVKRQALIEDVQAWDTRTNFALGAAISLGLTAGTLFLLDALEVGR
jgi:hypothetical protein